MLEKDDWLINAKVEYRITEVKSRWEVSLIFIDTFNPGQVLIRKISNYSSKRLAKIHAINMQKTATKYSQGTQRNRKDAYNYSKN